MSNGNQPDADSSARELPEAQRRDREPQRSESLEPIHENPTIHHPVHEAATILGGPGVQGAEADRSAAGGGLDSITDPSEFRRAVLEIGLATEDELDGLAAEVPASAGVLGLARVLQEAGKLTAYQAAALYQRKSRGLLIGNYLILDKLGMGGMGVVFKARHLRLGRVVALKILPPSFARDRTALARFKREVEAAGKLKHPNIVAALDADEDRGVHFLVMEFVEGRDLDRVIRQRGPLRVVEAIEYLIQAARGLAAAHAEGIVHRDIKPSNLMLDTAGTVRVLDLGLARIVDASNPFGQAAGGRLTESGMYMGTIDYMAPEQAEDSRRADQRADIYSLGCTLYYLMTGREPFVGETVLRRLMAHQERPAPPLRGARPEAPAALEDAFQQMMAKRPADRPESMTAVIALLETGKAAAAAAPATHPAAAPKPRPELKVFDEAVIKRAEPGKPGRESSISAPRDEPEGAPMGSGLSLEDLVMAVRSEALLPAPTIQRVVKPRVPQAAHPVLSRSKPARRSGHPAVFFAVGAMAVLGAAFLSFALLSRSTRSSPNRPSDSLTTFTTNAALAERAAGDGQSEAELAPHFAERGNARSADPARTKARLLFEHRLAQEPENSELAADLAQLLLDQQVNEDATRWTVLKPITMNSEGGATLTLQDDGSILAGGVNPPSDQYKVAFLVPERMEIWSIRLEALTHDSLPGNGPGRSTKSFAGVFALNSWDLTAKPPDGAGSSRRLGFRAAWTDFSWNNAPLDLHGGWNISFGGGKHHTSVWRLQAPIALGAGSELVSHMRFNELPDWSDQNLGRFRISVCTEPAVLDREQIGFAATKLTDPWGKLAVAYHVIGDQGPLETLVKHHPEAASVAGDLYAASQDWERAIAEYRKFLTDGLADVVLLRKLATAYQSAGRTREAVAYMARASADNPKDTAISMEVAALQAWFGQEKELAATRQRIQAFATDTKEKETAERAAKAFSILPCTDKAELEAALVLARSAMKLGNGPEWRCLLALGMAEYRSGNDVAADRALLAAAKANPNDPEVTGVSSFFRAMSLFRQGKKDEARKVAIAAAAKMKPLPADEQNPLAESAGHGDLIVWLAFKEAKAMIRFNAAPAPPETPHGK